jgi:hypothetical protein
MSDFNSYPFEVIQMTGNSEEIVHQLSPQSKRLVSKSGNVDLSKFSCLVIVVEKLRMGERLTPTCQFFDVRSRYWRAIDVKSTFIQDIGRCAG